MKTLMYKVSWFVYNVPASKLFYEFDDSMIFYRKLATKAILTNNDGGEVALDGVHDVKHSEVWSPEAY